MKNTLVRLLAASLFCATPVAAQSPCMDWSGEFALPGFDDSVYSFRTLDDGSGSKLYAVGQFLRVNGAAGACCARFDGLAWTPLLADPAGLVPQYLRDAAGFDDGSGSGSAAYAVGAFTRPGGGNFYGVAKRVGGLWLAVGNGTGVGTGTVDVLQVYDDGSGPALYAAGTYSTMDGLQVGAIARWNGSAWSALGTGISGASTGVLRMAVYDNGTGSKLYIGGGFTNVGGSSGVNRIAAWNGSSWAPLGSGLSDVVRALAVYNDGSGSKLYVGGDFTLAGGQSCAKIARWNGSWSTLPGGGVSSNSVGFARVDVLQVANPLNGPGNTLFIGGNFDFAGGLPANGVVGFRSLGWLQLGVGVPARVQALGAFNPGNGARLHIGCGWQAGGQAVSFAARWDGAAWQPEGPGRGVDNAVERLHSWDDGTGAALYAAGTFGAVAGTSGVRSLGRWNGTDWSAVGGGVDGIVQGLASVGSGAGSKLYVAGNFHFAGGIPANYVAAWDGSSWSALGNGLDLAAGVLAEFDDGSGPALYVGGDLSGIGAHGMVRWNGSSWSTVDSGFSGDVDDLEVFDDGSGPALYAIGIFVFSGHPTNVGLARWNGSSWTALSNVVNGARYALRAFDDGTTASLYLGGSSLIYNAVQLGALARWTGSTWNSAGAFGSSSGPPLVHALEVLDDGTGGALYAAGYFATVGGMPARNIARWSGTSWSALGGGLDNEGHALCAYDDGTSAQVDLYAGGIFRKAGNLEAARIACWFDRCRTLVGTTTCAGDGSLATPCPCANYGAPGHGCANSVNAQGAQLEAFGEIFPDSVSLHASGMYVNPGTSCIFLQVATIVPQGSAFGDGLLCAGGLATLVAVKSSPGGASEYPQPGDPPLSVRGGVLPGSGLTRLYQTCYRDPDPAFCPRPAGNSWNTTSGVQITW